MIFLAVVLLATPGSVAGDEPFLNVSQGAVVSVGAGTNRVGDHLVAELGVESAGLRSKDRRWLLQWDLSLAGRGGWLANAHPYLLFVGGRGRAGGELGARLDPPAAWSPYVGGRLDASIAAMLHPGLAFSDLDTINDSDSFGGLSATGLVRAAGGVSWLEGSKSLLLVAFAQERLRAPAVNSGGAAFSEGGLSVRFDLSQSLTVTLEGALGSTFETTTSTALHVTNHTIHEELAASLRKKFGRGFWLAALVSLGRDLEVMTWRDNKATFTSAYPPAFELGVAFGVPIGSQQ